jgi:hypothetical protein
MKNRWRWSLGGAVGLMLALALFVLPAMGDGPITSEIGVLRLQMNGGGDKLIFDPAAPGPNLVQSLSESNCKLSSSGASLVSIVGSGAQANKKPYAGLKDHRIGVGQNGEGNGEPCARINRDLGQKLTLSLTGDLAGQAIGYAEIDLGFKFNGDAILEMRRAGVLIDTVTVPCSGISDCGPDSGGSDNERVVLWVAHDPGTGSFQAFHVKGTFDSIVIRPGTASSSGVVALEAGFGGSDPGPKGLELGTVDSLFVIADVFDGEIDCTDTETLTDGPEATFQITRGYDLDGGCKGPEDGLLYNYESGTDGSRLFVNFATEPVAGDAVAQFLEEITWRFAGAPNVPGGASQHRTLSYDDGAGERVMPWCLKDPRDDGVNLPTGSVGSPVDTSQILPAGHTSCLVESKERVTGFTDVLSYPLGTFIKTDIVYNIGDGKRYT